MLRRVLAVTLASVMALTVAAPAALAEEWVCRGALGATTVDNLRVPQDATCTLIGTKVEGTVKVESGAKLYANARQLDSCPAVTGANAGE